MATILKLVQYLNANGVEFQLRTHAPAFTAHQVAVASHAPDSETAKTLIVQADKVKWMVVLRADQRMDQKLLRQALEVHSVHMVSGEELEELCPGCDPGAMPPFGRLYGLPVIVDKSLAEDEEIVFNACTHTESVRMKFRDFERLVKPLIAEFAVALHPEDSYHAERA